MYIFFGTGANKYCGQKKVSNCGKGITDLEVVV